MASIQPSPRERLRKLIDGDQEVLQELRKKRDQKRAPQRFRSSLSAFSESMLAHSLSLEKVLVGIALLMVFYLAFDGVSFFQLQQKSLIPGPSKALEKELAPAVGLRSLGYYLDPVTEKDLFGPVTEAKIRSARTERIVSSPAQTYEGLKLVGVSYEGIPEALIEDTVTGKTYFVKDGAWIGDKKIEKIDRDKVILRHKNKEVELK